MLIEIFERNLLTVIDQVRSISEVIDSADEEELPPPPQEQVGHHLHHHHHQQQIKDILFSTIVYIIINHNNIMFQHVSLAKVFGNITPTTSITESIILKNRKYCHLAILQPQDINYHANLFQMLANVRKGLPMASETDL